MSGLMANIEREETRRAEIGNALDNYTPKSYEHAGGSHSDESAQNSTCECQWPIEVTHLWPTELTHP